MWMSAVGRGLGELGSCAYIASSPGAFGVPTICKVTWVWEIKPGIITPLLWISTNPLKSTIKPNPLFGSPYSLKLSPHPTAPLHPLYPLGPSSPVASRRPAPQRIDEVQAGEAAAQCVPRGEGPQHRRAQERLCRHAVTELDTQRLGGRVVAAVAGTPAKPYSVLGRVQR